MLVHQALLSSVGLPLVESYGCHLVSLDQFNIGMVWCDRFYHIVR